MYELFTLQNGIRVICENINFVNSVSIGIFVKCGSRNETKDQNGISHFIEHMMFNGTKTRSARQISEEVENIGGEINAYTSKEYTCYFAKSLNTHTELLIDVLSDIFCNSEFEETKIEKEKSIILNEIAMNEDLNEDLLFDLHLKAIYDKDSLGLPILGTQNTVRGLNSSKLKEFIKNNYTKDNIVISVCGNFELSKLTYMLNKYFYNKKFEENKSSSYNTPKITNNFLSVQKDTEQLYVSLGLKGASIGDQKAYAQIIINNILGGGASSRLFQKIREEKGVCYSIDSYPLPYINVGTINIIASINRENAENALTYIKQVINNFCIEDISKEEIKINKEKIKSGYMLALENTQNRMFSNGKSILIRNKIIKPIDVIRSIDETNCDIIYEALNEYIKPGVINGAFIGKNVDFEKLEILAQNDIFA